jgi:hypothetical protein
MLSKFLHNWVLSTDDSECLTPSSSHSIIWFDCVVFHQRIVMKYDIYSKKRLNVLKAPQILLAFINMKTSFLGFDSSLIEIWSL